MLKFASIWLVFIKKNFFFAIQLISYIHFDQFKETEVRTFMEKIVALKISNIDALIAQLASIEKYIASDRIFAYEVFAKGGKKLLIDFIKECDRTSDLKKW